MARLQAHHWPGNIRELRNVLERALLFADDGVVRAEHLPVAIENGVRRTAAVPTMAFGLRGPGDDAELRRRAVAGDCTRRQLAQQFGLSERTLYRRLKALGVA